MPLKIGVDGYSRIGRTILRALYEQDRRKRLLIVAINELGDAQIYAHLTRYDTVHGRFGGEVKVDGNALIVNVDRMKVFSEGDPAKLPWESLGAELVLECTGLFTSKAEAARHLEGWGKKKVVISAPRGHDVDATIVYGVNHGVLKVFSKASCTTNCLTPRLPLSVFGQGCCGARPWFLRLPNRQQLLEDRAPDAAIVTAG